MAALHISLFGGFEAHLGSGEALPLKGRKTQALVAYLALSPGQPRSREDLVGLLWGDRGEPQARSSLRQSLSELRKALGDADNSPLITGRHTVSLHADALEVDVAAFERLIDDGTPMALKEAAELYRGELLDGIGVHDAAFEDWLRDERRRLQMRACEVLSKLLDHQATEDIEGAIATAHRLLALDPLQEASHRALMRLYVRKGERALALKQYHACRDFLAKHLGITPDPETEDLAEGIRIGESEEARPTDIPTQRPLSPAHLLPLPERPSIAVLPFKDMSGGPAQDHFAECIAEDINTALSKIPTLFVIDRTSTSVYRHHAVDVKQVGQEQGVRYVLKGSVQRDTNRVRVSAQLVDTTSGQNIWAQRFDRVIQDVFALQDEITRQVILALQVKLTDGERARILARGTENLEAWQLAIQASHYFNSHERQNVLEGRRLIDEALRLDEHYASAHTLLGWAHWMDAYDGWSEDPNKSIELTVKAARHSLALDPNNPETYALLAMAYILGRDYDQAWAQIDKATTLGPNNSKVLALTALVALWCERPKQAESLLRQAIRLCPISPAWYPGTLAEVYFALGQIDEAIEAAQASAESDPDYIHAYITLAVAYAAVGHIDEARSAAAEVRRLEPDFSVGRYARAQPYRDQRELARIVEGLRAAGLPD